MIERLWRSDVTKPARNSTDRCADIVFCGTFNSRANSPAGTPSGSCFAKRRNTSSRVRCASAARAKIAFSDSIHPELWIYHLPSSEMTNTCLANMPHDHGYEQGRSIAAEVSGDHEAERRVVALVGCGRHDGRRKQRCCFLTQSLSPYAQSAGSASCAPKLGSKRNSVEQ